MAKGFKTGGKNFEPGHKLGKGRPLIPEDLKSVRLLTKEEAERLIIKFMSMAVDELKVLVGDPHTPAMHGIIANIILKGIEGGDTMRMEFLFNRTIGRVLDKIEVTAVKPFVIKKPDGSVVLGAQEQDDE